MVSELDSFGHVARENHVAGETSLFPCHGRHVGACAHFPPVNQIMGIKNWVTQLTQIKGQIRYVTKLTSTSRRSLDLGRLSGDFLRSGE